MSSIGRKLAAKVAIGAFVLAAGVAAGTVASAGANQARGASITTADNIDPGPDSVAAVSS